MNRKLAASLGLVTAVAILVGYTVTHSARQQAAVPPTPDPQTLRQTPLGPVLGFRDGTSFAWLGIPYAEAARWRAPHAPAAWTSVRSAILPGSICPQFQRAGFGGEQLGIPKDQWGALIGSEDCLNLNIRSPQLSAAEISAGRVRLPVLVYLHGGGNTIGYGELYNYGNFAAQQRVIVVTINYRLGPLGWFWHPALAAEPGSDLDRSGNYGVLDMIAALQWVRENIAAFGGDSRNVTVFGLSTGGSNVAALLVSPLAHGLFQKAIIESGVLWHETFARASNYRDDPDPGQRHSSRELVNQLLMRDHGESRAQAKQRQDSLSPSELLGYLRTLPLDKLMAPFRPDNASGMYDTPNLLLDGVVLPKRPFIDDFASPATFNSVPMIVGSNQDEAKFYMLLDPRLVKTPLNLFLRAKNEALYQISARYRSDGWRAITVDDFADRVEDAHASPVYVYRFDWNGLSSNMFADLSHMLGAAHSIETAFIMGRFENFLGLPFVFKNVPDPAARDLLSQQMMSYWGQFAYTGAPGRGRDAKETEWTRWRDGDAGRGHFIIFDAKAAGGVRMSDQDLGDAQIKRRLAEDARIDQAERCRLYVQIYYSMPINAPWSSDEYARFGQGGCRSYDPEKLFWEEHSFNVGSAPGSDTFRDVVANHAAPVSLSAGAVSLNR